MKAPRRKSKETLCGEPSVALVSNGYLNFRRAFLDEVRRIQFDNKVLKALYVKIDWEDFGTKGGQVIFRFFDKVISGCEVVDLLKTPHIGILKHHLRYSNFYTQLLKQDYFLVKWEMGDCDSWVVYF